MLRAQNLAVNKQSLELKASNQLLKEEASNLVVNLASVKEVNTYRRLRVKTTNLVFSETDFITALDRYSHSPHNVSKHANRRIRIQLKTHFIKIKQEDGLSIRFLSFLNIQQNRVTRF